LSVQEILDQKPIGLITLHQTARIFVVTEKLSSANIGAILLTNNDGQLSGIISERDIVKAVTEYGDKVSTLKADDLMKRNIVTCRTEADLCDVLALMSKHSVRHIPVIHDENLVGLVSVRDILNTQQQLLIADIDRRNQDSDALHEAHESLAKAFAERTAKLAETENDLRRNGTLLDERIADLEASQSRYRSVVKGSNFGIQISRKDGTRIYFNPIFVNMLGYGSMAEMIAVDSDGAFVAPHHREWMLDNRKARTRGEAVLEIYEYDALRKDGAVIPLQK